MNKYMKELNCFSCVCVCHWDGSRADGQPVADGRKMTPEPDGLDEEKSFCLCGIRPMVTRTDTFTPTDVQHVVHRSRVQRWSNRWPSESSIYSRLGCGRRENFERGFLDMVRTRQNQRDAGWWAKYDTNRKPLTSENDSITHGDQTVLHMNPVARDSHPAAIGKALMKKLKKKSMQHTI